MIEIFKHIKVLRTQRGWTQRKLAEKSGLSKSLIADIETGVKTYLSMAQINALAEAFGVTVEEVRRKQL